jgi:anthranilate synthase component II
MKILVLDNYDSFTYNLVQYVEEMSGIRPDVFRNDEITVAEAAQYDKILLSPGPGLPAESGILCDLIRELAPTKSIFGVCHGVATLMHVRKVDEPLFREIPETFAAGRYHSWVVSKIGLPDCFDLTCEDEDGQIMGLTHKKYDVRGVQFHPESVMTEHGKVMVKNWITN